MNWPALLAESAVRAALVLLLATLCCRIMRRRSAATRHVVWAAALGAALLLPVALAVLPPMRTAGSPAVFSVVRGTAEVATVAATAPVRALPALSALIWPVWLGGTTLVLLWIAAGLLRVWWITRRAKPAPGLSPALAPADVLVSRDLPMPTTWGVLRPVVLLPEEARDWPSDWTAAVLTHEFEHIYRRDWLTQLTAHMACALYWFNPLVWLASRQLRRERELACDDGVLANGTRPSDYAQHLVEIARASVSSRAFSGGLAMAQKSGLEMRVRAMLDPRARRDGASRRLVAGAAVAALALVVGLSTARSTAFASGVQGEVMTSAADAGKRGTVSGWIRDPAGMPLTGARVRLSNKATGGREITKTGPDGRYELRAPEGAWIIEAAYPDYAKYNFESVLIREGQSSEHNIVLQHGLGVVGGVAAGASVQPPKIVHKVEPKYPEHLKEQKAAGIVLLTAVIGRDGNVVSAEALNSDVDKAFVEAAISAVKTWKFEPARLNGEPVEVRSEVEVNFELH